MQTPRQSPTALDAFMNEHVRVRELIFRFSGDVSLRHLLCYIYESNFCTNNAMGSRKVLFLYIGMSNSTNTIFLKLVCMDLDITSQYDMQVINQCKIMFFIMIFRN